jgi:hypothetical protein
LITITLLPLVLVGITSAFYRKEGRGLVAWRRLLFVVGIAANGVSAAVLSIFSIHGYLASRGTEPVDLDRMYPVLSMMMIGLLAAGFGCCGRRVSRVLLIGDGLLTTVFWYFVALAASP